MRGQQTEADRIAELKADPQCREFDAHRCLCDACGRWVHLSGRAHKIFNWRRHKKGCSFDKSRNAITIIHARKPNSGMSMVGDENDGEVDELEDSEDEMDSPMSKYSSRSNAFYARTATTHHLQLSTSADSATSYHSRMSHTYPYPPPVSYPMQSSHSSHHYDPSAKVVVCDDCSTQMPFRDYNGHKRTCRSGLHHRQPLTHVIPPPPYSQSQYEYSSSPSSTISLPPLRSLTTWNTGHHQSPSPSPSLSSYTSISPSNSVKSPSMTPPLPSAASDGLPSHARRHPPRRIEDLCDPMPVSPMQASR
ncbi:hypothetical protein SISSUDRAFT_1053041 [Sistotremastrum suecicum HHB10207 ss-3]|uniref:Uncharacterized protein n=1 Tax=Sistotremastrum suecicum HHB10207 ss-3 TaxID=1314776 RepID=A0A165ZG05_9AGAM|nr:hypothetical protein SISSUDRAFT_1053041 [Sistotremastrum suecicum HHB10207 ss-3]